jgi:hypothetical protein
VTHPHQLHAQAALWALDGALVLLADRADQEDRAIAAEYATAAVPLRSPAYGHRQALGGHGDPTAEAAGMLGAPPRQNRWTDLEVEVQQQLLTVAAKLPGDGWWNPVAHLRAALPTMSERSAAATAQLADRIDARIRRLLVEPDDRLRLPRVPCPACDTAGMLVLRTSAPEPERVVECTACDGAWPAAAMRSPAA